MSYSVGGTIQATDYNTIVGASGTASGSLNYVYSTGSGAIGYGQTAVSTLTAGTLVTAAQWTTMLTPLNKCLAHQSQTQLAYTYTTGQTIKYLANVKTAVTQINTTYANAYATGGTTTGTVSGPRPTAAVNTQYGETTLDNRYATWTNGDCARYFFNAGGYLNFVTTSIVNNNGSSRSNGFTGLAINYTLGQAQYSALTTSAVGVNTQTEGGTYSGDFIKLYTSTNGTNLSGNGDYGNQIRFYLNLYSAAHGSWDTALDVTWNHRVDIVYPETTYLSSSTIAGSWLPTIT